MNAYQINASRSKRFTSVVLGLLLCISLSAFAAGLYQGRDSLVALSLWPLGGFVALFAAEVLGYRIGGSHLQLEKRLEGLETSNSELKQSVNALLKALFVLEHGSSLWEGTTDKHYALVARYLQPIEHLVDGDLRSQVTADLAGLHPAEPQDSARTPQ